MKQLIIAVCAFSVIGGFVIVKVNAAPAQPASNNIQATASSTFVQPAASTLYVQPATNGAYLQPAANNLQ